MNTINKFFQLRENNTTVKKELIAGLTTFFAMVYIIFVNPNILTGVNTPNPTGMDWDAVFLATILSTVVGTLVMALFANVPYSLAPGMGLNAFFASVVCGTLGFSWQEGLALVFICGLINVLITVTKVRKSIIKAIPPFLQNAIGAGIGAFIAYLGFMNGGLLTNGSLTNFNNMGALLTILGIIVTVVLLVLKVKGAILIGIIVTTLLGALPFIGKTSFDVKITWDGIALPFKNLQLTFGQALGKNGLLSLFSSWSKLPIAIFAIFAFSLTDTFDTIGTFVGTGRKSGVFTDADMAAIENSHGFKTKMEKALFADSIATSIGAILGTSNTTTYIESSAGIEAGGRTGLTSVFTAFFFLLCTVLSPIVGIVPAEATAPALVIVGIMMFGSFAEINWKDFSEAVPAFFASIVMAFVLNISTGIALGFIFYIIVKACKKELKEVHPILWGSSILFILNFVLMALLDAGIFK